MTDSKFKKIAKTVGLQLFLPTKSGVNWEIATGIAMDISEESPFEASGYLDAYQEIIKMLDPVLEETTGYQAKSHIPLVCNRHDWIITTIESTKSMFGDVVEESWNNLKNSSKNVFVEKTVKSTITAEIGLLIGYLSGKVLAQYDLINPNTQNACLYFVEPNIAMRQKQLGLDAGTFRFWITLHELAHKFQFENNPWIQKYYFDLIDEAKKVINKPADKKQNLSIIFNSDNLGLISRIQAFMSVVEGYADFVMFTAAKNLPNYESTAPIFQRKKSSNGLMKDFFDKILGFDMKINQYRNGFNFISSVAQVHGLNFFQENLKDSNSVPTLEEISYPDLWIKRVTG